MHDQLIARAGQEILRVAQELAPTDATRLACLTRLRKQAPVELAQLALEQVLLREKARQKFSRAADMLFTREGLEVASGEGIAEYRALRFARFTSIADLCCGIGGDTLSLARVAEQIQVCDVNPVVLKLAEHNLAVHGLSARATFTCADVLTGSMPDADAYFADPARRTGGKRISTLDETQPSPRALLDRLPKNAAVAFKLAPGISLADQQNLEGELEFLSVQGELKECVWWSGPLRSTRRRATLLPSGYSLASESEREMSPPGEPQRYLFEPDAAIVRAGLVPLLAEQLDAQPLDHLVQLLTSDEPRATPFGQWWEVMAVCKYDLKAVNAELRRHDIGRVTPVHYGAAPDAAEWSKRLKPVGSRSARLVLTRVLGRFVVVICSAE